MGSLSRLPTRSDRSKIADLGFCCVQYGCIALQKSGGRQHARTSRVSAMFSSGAGSLGFPLWRAIGCGPSPPARRCCAMAPAPGLVFVDGLMGYTFSWRHNLEFFAQHRDVYAVDLLGIGHSDRPRTGAADFSLAAAASNACWLSCAHSANPASTLIGTSHGGAVAMLASSLDRSWAPRPLIRRLALVAPAHPFMTDARLRHRHSSVPAWGGMVRARWLRAAEPCAANPIGRMYVDESLASRPKHAPDMRSISTIRAPTSTPWRWFAPGARTCKSSGPRCPPSPDSRAPHLGCRGSSRLSRALDTVPVARGTSSTSKYRLVAPRRPSSL